MADSAQRSVTLAIRAPLRREDLLGLLERTCVLLAADAAELLAVDVGEIFPDAVAVDALARLALAARRSGCGMTLRGASAQLLLLIGFVGLDDVLRAEEEVRP